MFAVPLSKLPLISGDFFFCEAVDKISTDI